MAADQDSGKKGYSLAVLHSPAWAKVVYWTGKGQSSITYLIHVVVFIWDVERRLSL
jgi:phosphopantothenoylcysteine synthetase/decarboxylase